MSRSIPSMDFRLALSEAKDERQRFINEVGDALKDIGFFALTNHGIPRSLIVTRPTPNAMPSLIWTRPPNEVIFARKSATSAITRPLALSTPRTTLLPISRNFGKPGEHTPPEGLHQPTRRTSGQPIT